jgi:Glycosyl hydrolases family 18
MTRQVRNLLIVCGVFLLLLIGVGIVFAVISPPKAKLTPGQLQQLKAEQAARRLLKTETKDVTAAKKLLAVSLPTKKNSPAPAAGATLFAKPLRSHEVWNFLQYFDLGTVNVAELSASSAVIYSGVCVSSTGSIDDTAGECGDETTALASAAFTTFVGAAHAAGASVLLSVNAFDDTTIAPLVADPAQSASTLATAVLPILSTDGLNGVNLDIEGSDPTESKGFVAFVTAFVGDIRETDPSAEIVLDSYAGSAAGSSNFFDIHALAPLVNRIFVEAYQLNDSDLSSPNAPIASSSLGYSVVQTLVQYEKEMPPSELILGVPFYGLDYTTVGSRLGSEAVTASPIEVTYDAVATAGRKSLWDPASMTPYSIFRSDGKWHQLWFEDPASIALKVALAVKLGAAGVGAWSLGMESDSSAMLTAMTGGIVPKKIVPQP